MKVTKKIVDNVTHYEGTWCSIGVHQDGRGQVMIGFPDTDGRQVSKSATIPQVWAFLEYVEGLDRDELDTWVMEHLPPSQSGTRWCN